jgi:hypothetical protein
VPSHDCARELLVPLRGSALSLTILLSPPQN